MMKFSQVLVLLSALAVATNISLALKCEIIEECPKDDVTKLKAGQMECFKNYGDEHHLQNYEKCIKEVGMTLQCIVNLSNCQECQSSNKEDINLCKIMCHKALKVCEAEVKNQQVNGA